MDFSHRFVIFIVMQDQTTAKDKPKLKNEPIFLLAALIVFFPAGLFFLLRSELPAKRKCLLGSTGAIFFILLLIPAAAIRSDPVKAEDFQLHVTREELSVGQSGGFYITDGSVYCNAFSAAVDNDVLYLQDNLYTASRPGQCTLTVFFGEEERKIRITVNDEPKTGNTVLASPSGTRYHRAAAAHAGSKAVEMTEEEALQSGKTPCKICYS